MSALAILIVGGLLASGLWVWLAGRGEPGARRADPLGLRSAREIVEDREALEAEDLAQMLEAHNARRRRRGEPERTVEDIELLVASDRVQLERRRAAELADAELDQLLAATNARRRARGLPERTRDEVRLQYGAEPATGG